MNAAVINDGTPIVTLTLGQLKEALQPQQAAMPDLTAYTPEAHVFGLRGIMKLLGVSKATAQRYKDGILRPSVMQNGRKIVVDKQKAIELFKQAQTL